MARISQYLGKRYKLNEHIYEIKQILTDGFFLVSDLSFGGEKRISLLDIAIEMRDNDLQFEVSGKNTIESVQNGHRFKYKYSDFSLIMEKYRTIAWERYLIIKDLVGRTRTHLYIKLHIDEVYSEANFEAIKKKPGLSTVYRWVLNFEKSGGDIRSLVPEYGGNKGKSRLCEELDKLIAEAISQKYMQPERPTCTAIHEEVEYQVIKKNESLADDKKIKVPVNTTIWNKIKQLDPRMVAECRFGKQYANELFKPIKSDSTIEYTRPLEATYMDNTETHLFVIDEIDNLPIGRAYFTLNRDAATHYPLGLYCGFDPPSYSDLGECLYHSILPKDYVSSLYPKIKEPWLAYGVPEKILCDNGTDYTSQSFKNACLQLGITVDYGRPVSGKIKYSKNGQQKCSKNGHQVQHPCWEKWVVLP